MSTIPQYGVWHFEGPEAFERLEVSGPDGSHVRHAFEHHPGEFAHDDHGYEAVRFTGAPRPAARFAPVAVGEHRWRALAGDQVVAEGRWDCVVSTHPGYVGVSQHDPRYFATSRGDSYVAVGLDLCWPVAYPLSAGTEFALADDTGTLGLGDYRRWFAKMRRHGANFARIWLSNRYFAANAQDFDTLDPRAFVVADGLLALAREHGVRLKLCFENFRSFDPEVSQHTTLRGADGSQPADMDEWYTGERWQTAWWRKVEAYTRRYADDPTVMAWELWNEIDAARVTWSVARDWTRATLTRLRPLVPRQLVVNSLGSYDHADKQSIQDDFKMAEMDFQQVHRYLDQGAAIPFVRDDPVAFSVDAVQRARRPDRPVLLAETGAVNDHHSGPFRYYRHDDEGCLFADTTFPAFFAGAAGSGHIWHWDRYVDEKDLWDGFAPLAELLAGVAVDRQGFAPEDLSGDGYRALALLGREVHLLWLRNRADRWDHVLRDATPAPPLADVRLELAPFGAVTVESCRGWREPVGPATVANGALHLPTFRRMLFVRLRRQL